MNIQNTLNKATTLLLGITKTPRLEAEILLAHIINKDRSYLVINSDKLLASKEVDQFMSQVMRRKMGTPIAYLTGKKEFYGLDFEVNEFTLIPRPETELLVELAIKYISTESLNTIYEVGTGTGCISIALAKNTKLSTFTATDISNDGLSIAINNAERLLSTEERSKLTLIQSDVFDSQFKDEIDLLISNPPYIPTSELDSLPLDVKSEPECALDGGKDGMKYYNKLNEIINENVTKKGVALFEIHSTLAKETVNIFNDKDVLIHKDLSGKPRVIEVRKN